MRTAKLISDIIDGLERLVINIRKLYSSIRMRFRTKKNATL